jgi:hypothetical protein
MEVGNVHFMVAGQFFEYVVVPRRYGVVDIVLC